MGLVGGICAGQQRVLVPVVGSTCAAGEWGHPSEGTGLSDKAGKFLKNGK